MVFDIMRPGSELAPEEPEKVVRGFARGSPDARGGSHGVNLSAAIPNIDRLVFRFAHEMKSVDVGAGCPPTVPGPSWLRRQLPPASAPLREPPGAVAPCAHSAHG